MSPLLKKVFALLLLLVVVNIGFVWYGQASFDATFQSLAKAFTENNASSPHNENLPPAVTAHLERTGIAHKEYGTILFQMEGLYRKKPSSKGAEMHALALLRPTPDMLWAIRLKSNPLVTFNALETYHAGMAKMKTLLFGIIPMGDFDSEAFARSELARVLAYGLFNPLLLASDRIDYESLDDRHIRATIHDGNLTASVVFESDREGRFVGAVSHDRVRPGKKGLQPADWQLKVISFGDFDGLHLPASAEESWSTEEGSYVYATYKIESAKRL